MISIIKVCWLHTTKEEGVSWTIIYENKAGMSGMFTGFALVIHKI